ncbi:MAG: MATE family efflux transporter [Oscillospiraceae bacterium]|nr:MATE family efflux transporter [Oscillospiraceae bacterium]
MREDQLARLRRGEKLTLRQQILLTLRLSVPAILAQLSTIAMQYIDASMVGQLGAGDAASIGLVASTTWLFGGLTTAAVLAFTVQVAQRIGAGDEKDARNLMKQGMVIAVLFSLLLAAVGAAIAGSLPVWLRADPAIRPHATAYFLIFALSLPIMALSSLGAGMLQSSGNMRTPSILMALSCLLDVVFNALLIFPARTLWGVTVPGAGLGVIGAALGTSAAHAVNAALLLFFLLRRSPALHLRRGEKLRFVPEQLRRGWKLALPVAAERVIMCSAQIVSTGIIAPLGTVAIAAHSFAITAEALCYMPGYGMEPAASTLIGQSVGAERRDLTYRLGWLVTTLAMVIMGLSAVVLFFAAPYIIGVMTPDREVVALATAVLRIVLLAEPLYGASIVASGAFQGAGNTLPSTVLNLASMWCVRIPLTAALAARYGLPGAWVAMTIELAVRGTLFLLWLGSKRWLPREWRQKTK